jgi:hypothetical protein
MRVRQRGISAFDSQLAGNVIALVEFVDDCRARLAAESSLYCAPP